mmetsp:Transcript_13281/g.26989  ORF Transcript_13281/g.26989 Transcript_13281/m.26989 type:complete len:110 (+) Transcript_13281:801-1130(+)
MGSDTIILLDTRVPSLPVAELRHSTPLRAISPKRFVNAISWAPHSATHLCSGGDDCFAFLWDVTELPDNVTEPILAYDARSPVNNLDWSPANPDWLAIVHGCTLEILRV